MTSDMTHGSLRFQVSIGYYDGDCKDPAEVFVSGTKVGSDVDATTRDGSVLLSLALQYGVPVEVMAGAITRGGSGEPSTIIGSVLDRLLKDRA
jgi:hypothetical protein